MNRSAIDEEAGSEVLKVFELEKTSTKIRRERNRMLRNLKLIDDPDYDAYYAAYNKSKFKKALDHKGIDFFVLEFRYLIFTCAGNTNLV